jgi:hypothetical protein
MNDGFFLQSPEAFTSCSQLEYGTRSDMDMVPWLGQPIVAPPYAIDSNSPPSTGRISNLPSPRIAEWGLYEENAAAAQGSGLLFVPSLDVPAQCPGAHPNHFNIMSERGSYQENVAAVHESGLFFVPSSYSTPDVPAPCPGAHPNHFSCMWCNSNLKVAYHPSLYNFAHVPVAQDNTFTNPNIVPPVAQHAKRTKYVYPSSDRSKHSPFGRRAKTYPSLTKRCHHLGCGKEFDSRNSGNLPRHIRSVHTRKEDRDENLRCEPCNVSFSRMDGKREHIKRKHTIRRAT